jgi:hypothetical protein
MEYQDEYTSMLAIDPVISYDIKSNIDIRHINIIRHVPRRQNIKSRSVSPGASPTSSANGFLPR